MCMDYLFIDSSDVGPDVNIYICHSKNNIRRFILTLDRLTVYGIKFRLELMNATQICRRLIFTVL